MLGLCVHSPIAPVPERNQFYSKVVPTDASFPPVEPRISGGMQFSRQRIRGKRMDFTLPFPVRKVFIRTCSYAEMAPEQKNGLSHRYRALAKLKEHLVTLNQ